MNNEEIYFWPNLIQDVSDMDFAKWAYSVKEELAPVYASVGRPLPEDPVLIDEFVTNEIDGWLPRVAAMAVRAEFWLNRAKGAKWPSKEGAEGKLTEGDRNAKYDADLAPYRFVRDELDSLVKRMTERVRWSQSVRKQHSDAQ